MLNGLLHLETSALLLFKESLSLFLSLCHLLVEDFILPILEVLEILNLPFNQLLSGLLLLLELLVLLLSPQLLHCVSLLSIFFNSFFFLFLLPLSFFRILLQLFIGLSEVVSLILLLELPFPLLLSFSLQLFLDLSADEFSL